MKLFDLGPLFEHVREKIEAGETPDPAIVEMIIQEGPKAIDEWFLMVEEVEGDVETIKAHLEKMRARLAAKEQTVERMKGAVQDILKRHFPKVDKAGNITGYGLKTALGTYYVQKTPVFTFTGADPVKNPQFFKFPDPEFKKSEAIRVYKEGVLPENVTVTEEFTESVRCRR